MTKVDGNIVGAYDGVVRIICGDKAKTIYLSSIGLNSRFVNLNDCLKEIKYKGVGVVVVIIDEHLRGDVYMYNNYGNGGTWYKYGKTEGIA